MIDQPLVLDLDDFAQRLAPLVALGFRAELIEQPRVLLGKERILQRFPSVVQTVEAHSCVSVSLNPCPANLGRDVRLSCGRTRLDQGRLRRGWCDLRRCRGDRYTKEIQTRFSAI